MDTKQYPVTRTEAEWRKLLPKFDSNNAVHGVKGVIDRMSAPEGGRDQETGPDQAFDFDRNDPLAEGNAPCPFLLLWSNQSRSISHLAAPSPTTTKGAQYEGCASKTSPLSISASID
jgi:hypothetical protein